MPFFTDGPNRKLLLIHEIWSHSLIWALWTPLSLGWDLSFLRMLLQILWGRFISVPPRTQSMICNLYLRLGGINQSFSLTSSLRTLFAGIYLQSYWMLGDLTALEERCFLPVIENRERLIPSNSRISDGKFCFCPLRSWGIVGLFLTNHCVMQKDNLKNNM